MKIIDFGYKPAKLNVKDDFIPSSVQDNNILIVEMTQEEYNRMITLYNNWKDQVDIFERPFNLSEENKDE